MKGAHRIIVQNKRIRYDFRIKRNLTVIRGDSATGKTTLVDMIREYFENGSASAVELTCDKQCSVLEGRTWQGQLSEIRDSIVFIDEGNDFVSSKDFAAAIQKTDNYYVIVTREGIPTLPYSVEEIYGIRESGKYGTLKRTYNELYRLYPAPAYGEKIHPNSILTEDSNSGFQFFTGICEKNGHVSCNCARGKSNIFSIASEYSNGHLLVIADGSAFGPEMDKMMELVKDYPDITMYLPESFEWMILSSGILEDRDLPEILEHPENQIDSSEFFSWERYFNACLVQLTRDSYLKYNKRQLNPAYLGDKVSQKIVDVMEGVDLSQETC